MSQQYPTFQELADKALFNQADVQRLAELSPQVVQKMFRKEPVRRYTLLRALDAINEKLGTNYTPETVDAPYN